MSRTSIDEGETLWDILTIAEDYEKQYRITPVNISHWDQSEYFKNQIIEFLTPPLLSDPINYIFSYELQEAQRVCSELGFNANKHGILITPSGSVSILCVLVALKEYGIRDIVALSPYYWSMRHVAKKLQIDIHPIYLEKYKDSFVVPECISKEQGKHTALWITSPIYCTGVYYDVSSINFLKNVSEKYGFTVIDESLAIHRKEIGPEFSMNSNVISIHTPHKSVCTNGLKFSCVMFPERYQNHFDQWSDALYGCMSLSNKEAVLHFLSPNFKLYSSVFHKQVEKCREKLLLLCDKYSIQYDNNAHGYLNTVYFPSIEAGFISNPKSVWDMLVSCNGYFIPGSRNHFSTKFGLCFRVNHALDSTMYWAVLERIFRYLSSV